MLRSIRLRPIQTPFIVRTRNFWWSSSNPTSISPIKTDALLETLPTDGTPPIDSTISQLSSIPNIGDATPIGTTLVDTAPIGTTLVDTASQLTSISQLGDFKLLGLASGYTPVGWIEQLVEITHISLGLPWIGTIICSTVALRLMLLPLAIKAQRGTAKAALIKPELDPIQADLQKYKEIGDQMGLHLTVRKMQELLKKHDYNPLVTLLSGFGQFPVFISAFLALKKIGELPVPGLSQGGIGWITDLSVADPYYILPILSSVTNLLSFEVNKEAIKTMNPTMRIFLRVTAFLSIPFMGHFPAAVFVYLTTNGMFQLCQNLAFRNPRARAFLKLPSLTKPTVTPIKPVKQLSFMETLKEINKDKMMRQ